ncbi:MAG: cryptochrome/photolyase family protein [Rickettsiales bacterium]
MTNVIHWFRQDLRLQDNPALYEASKKGEVLAVYILDDVNAQDYKMGGASRWWLHHSLDALNKSLDGKLALYAGNPEHILPELVARHGIDAVYWNRCYEPWSIHRDKRIKELLDIEAHSFNGSLLWEPREIAKDDGTPYKVFTPFYRKGCLKVAAPRQPLPAPKLSLVDDSSHSSSLDDLHLLPTIPWDSQLEPHWQISEQGAEKRLSEFLEEGLAHYKDGRNLPAKPYTSRLSPYLHFGQISANQVWSEVRMRGDDKNVDHFCSELGWREFSYSLLYHNPTLPTENLQKKFDAFPWQENEAYLEAWQKGQTGFPIVDAGMRELWQTGYMHNRVRMIVGSFLVKNLLMHWHHGERWFWDCLVDADLANNSASWQWIAGTGADAAPYFRIFNPVTQGHKLDPEGEYTRRYVPELASLPNKYLFSPWDAPKDVLKESGITLGDDYPHPIVDLKESRTRALDAFQSLKKEA